MYTKNAAARSTWSECKQLNIHLYVNIQMYIYLLTFQSDMNIILLPYKKASLHDLQKIVSLHYTSKKFPIPSKPDERG